MIFPRSRVMVFNFLLAISAFCIPAVSCSSTKTQPQPPVVQPPPPVEKFNISLIFAGDIMAHSINYKAGNFSLIWDDVKSIIKQGDLAFANLEAPVNDNVPWATYPQFNMHSSYVQEAVNAGFNVFSLANNHTNDGLLDGINATKKYFDSRKDIWAAGLKAEKNGKISYKVIEKNGFKILFVAFTEILNRPDYSSWIDYYPQKKRENLITELKNLEKSNPHDLFVVSIHTDEEEYKTKVTENHKNFYKRLATECNADIIWANHPHVSKVFEKQIFEYTKEDNTIGKKQAFIMYANGNTISGQRTSPSFSKTPNERDDTGDGLIIKLNYEKVTENNISTVSQVSAQPYFITTYIQPNGQMVIRHVDEDLLHCLKRAGIPAWANYLEKRKVLYEELKGKSLWQ